MINFQGASVYPSFRVTRGETLTQIDEGGLYYLMHPYDIAVRLAESGEPYKGLAALEGFIRREIDIKADAAVARIEKMYA